MSGSIKLPTPIARLISWEAACATRNPSTHYRNLLAAKCNQINQKTTSDFLGSRVLSIETLVLNPCYNTANVVYKLAVICFGLISYSLFMVINLSLLGQNNVMRIATESLLSKSIQVTASLVNDIIASIGIEMLAFLSIFYANMLLKVC